jgi:hypothetical protein
VNTILVKHLVGTNQKTETQETGTAAQRGIVGRMINKMYGVGQHYGSSVNGKIFSSSTD